MLAVIVHPISSGDATLPRQLLYIVLERERMEQGSGGREREERT